MSIREAALADADDIARLSTELGYPTDATAISDRLARLITRKDHRVLVAVLEEKLVGWLQARADDVLESGFRVEIVGLVVGEKFRRRGVGRQLVHQIEEWAHKIGAQSLVVRSNTQRVESHQFYPALGFQTVKTQAVYRKLLPPKPIAPH
jgi:GNAT superfamily N-acetyltransferase